MTDLNQEQVLKIKSILAEESDSELTVDDISDKTLLRDDLDMDSMQAVSLMLDLEDWLEIELEGDDIEQAATVGDLITIVGKKLSEREDEVLANA